MRGRPRKSTQVPARIAVTRIRGTVMVLGRDAMQRWHASRYQMFPREELAIKCRSPLVAAALTAVVLSASGCTDSGDGSPPPTPTPTTAIQPTATAPQTPTVPPPTATRPPTATNTPVSTPTPSTGELDIAICAPG